MFNGYSEKDIENAFCEYLPNNLPMMSLVGSQIRLPIGIADLVFAETDIRRDGEMQLVVAEIKKGTIDLEACGQLLSYVEQIRSIVSFRIFEDCEITSNYSSLSSSGCMPSGILVGSSITREATRFLNSISPSTTTPISFYSYEYKNGNFIFNDSDFEHTDLRKLKFDERLESAISNIVAFYAEG